MKQTNRYTIAIIGILVQLPAIMAVPTIAVGLAFREWLFAIPVAIMGLISLLVGQLLVRTYMHDDTQSKASSTVAVALGWLIIAVLGAIPFFGAAILAGQHSDTLHLFQNPLNALFESMSGFTSTGLSVSLHPSELPHTLQWWRSFTEWIGGVGVVVLALIMVDPGEGVYQLYSAEAREQRVGDTIRDTARHIWWIYLLFTVLSIGLYLVAGMPWWQSINHGMAAISTGGFTITDDSFVGYSSAIKLVSVFIISLGAISFRTHYHLMRKRNLKFVLKQTEVRLYGALLLAGFVVLVLLEGKFLEAAPVDMLFQWTSALGTCGFSAISNTLMHPVILLLLTLGMIVGGTSGSTTGGLKLNRVAWLLKGIAFKLRSISPGGKLERPFSFDGVKIDGVEGDKKIRSAAILLSLWIIALFVSSMLLLFILGGSTRLSDVLFESASALGNVGLSTGLTGPGLPASAKGILIALMWLGRLEIIAVLVLFATPLKLLHPHKQGS